MYITKIELGKMAGEVLAFLEQVGINKPEDFEKALGTHSRSGSEVEINVRKHKINGDPCAYILGIRECYGASGRDIMSIVLSGVKGNTRLVARTNERLENYSLHGMLPTDGCGNILQAREYATTKIEPVREELKRLARL